MQIIPNKTFYFVRHGQTEANATGLMCGGEWDIPLNEIGHEQSLALSRKIESLNPSIEKIITSPMVRAQETAKNINSHICLEVTTLEGLREWCVGDWERQPWENVPNPFNTTDDPTNGESREEFKRRVVETVSRALRETNKTILFVSHGAFAHVLFTVMGVDQLQIENCEVYKVCPTGNKWCLSKVS